MYRRLSFAATVSGVILQLAGLALDAALHARDATLAAREHIFTLSNPGHLLFAAGLALTVFGVSTTLLALLLRGASGAAPANPGADRNRRTTATIALALIVMATLALAGSAFTGHAHGGSSPHHDEDERRTHHTGEVDHTDEINISWEHLREIDSMLAEAKASTEKYRDVERARADGYRQVTGVLPKSAAHFVNQQHLDSGGFDVAHPEWLLYDYAADGSFELAGVAFMLPRQSDDETPPTRFGPLAAWHEHEFAYPCLTTRNWGRPVTTSGTEADCRAAGNVFIPPKFWMLHVWLFRPSPEGVFSHENSTVKGEWGIEGTVTQ